MASKWVANLICPARDRAGARPGGWLLWRAPAKLNLALRVSTRRSDGFHEIESVAAKVTLYDEVLLRRRDDGAIHLDCSAPGCGPTEDNLVLRAAALLADRTAPSADRGVDICLVKQIPPEAGLGGGSSDAAAALLALNALWGLDLPRERLAELAAELGSDVPLFLAGPTVCVTGRGECVRTVKVHPFWAVLLLPPLTCRTGEVYAAYDDLAAPDSPPPRTAVNAERFALPPSQWGGAVFNDLQPAAERVCPPLAAAAEGLARATGCTVHMTGSGSGLFVLADDRPQACRAADALPEEIRGRCRIVSMNPW